MSKNQPSEKTVSALNKTGNRVFCCPEPVYDYCYLVEHALAPNTFRGFHRIDQSRQGASKAFRNILLKMSADIVKAMKSAKTERDIDVLSNQICKRLRTALNGTVVPQQLASYNKLRKPVDIFIEHLVAMGNQFSSQERKKLTKLLFLPLDSQIFKSEVVFHDGDIDKLGLRRSFTFSSVRDRDHYSKIQEWLLERASSINLEHRIYFDLTWNDRYKSKGKNLFETNP